MGGGYGGATAAKYVRLLSDYKIDVVLVEPNASFVSCPISNLVVGGYKSLGDVTSPYDKLSSKHGVKMVQDMVTSIDAAKKTVTLAGGATIGYDKLILSPGVDMMWDTVEGLQAAQQAGQILQAWKAGPETVALRRQLEAMPDGGVYAIAIPEAPYRCPPGPYERASQVASYLKRAKPKSKVLILDANPDVTSKGPLFKKFWAENYAGILEYRSQHKATAVDVKTNTVKFDVQNDVKADVLNVLPAMSAGGIAMKSGLANVNARWCNVHYLTFESTAAKDVHVIGDAIQLAPLMPKSGHMANSHGKGGGSGRGGPALGPGGQPATGADQHLLQLRQRQARGPRGVGAPVRRQGQDVQDRAGFGRRLHRAQRTRRRLRAQLGAEYLGRHTGLKCKPRPCMRLGAPLK